MLSFKRRGLRIFSLVFCAIAIPFTVYSQSAKTSQSFDSRSAQTAPASLDREVRADMAFLSDDDLHGRGSATRDEHIAALFAASQFQALGLEPGAPDNSYIQKSPLPDPLPEATKRRLSRFEDIPRTETWNAIAILRGSDPKLKDEVILLTAHLDHLGLAAQPINGDSIFNGADDDASGTTAVLTLAHILTTGPRPKRTVVFALFGSEEIGGFGARAFLASPPAPLQNIVANLEFEMIGRPDPTVPEGTPLAHRLRALRPRPRASQTRRPLGPGPPPQRKLLPTLRQHRPRTSGHHRPHRLQLRPPHRLSPAHRRTQDHRLHPHGQRHRLHDRPHPVAHQHQLETAMELRRPTRPRNSSSRHPDYIDPTKTRQLVRPYKKSGLISSEMRPPLNEQLLFHARS